MKKNSPTITFRITHEGNAKLERYMAAIEETNRSKCLNKAIELGLDILEIQGYDASRALAYAITSNTPAQPKQETRPVAPELKALPPATQNRSKVK